VVWFHFPGGAGQEGMRSPPGRRRKSRLPGTMQGPPGIPGWRVNHGSELRLHPAPLTQRACFLIWNGRVT
jgi:hypothetical protein